MVIFPTSKINLGLHVLEKRQDGYHNLSTCFYPVSLSDVVEIIPAEHFAFSTTGITIPGEAEDNLVVKAYHLLAKEYKLPPVAIHLHKIIPLGSGLGGGSADAVSVLTLLNKIFALTLSSSQRKEYALKLGSDCPFFVDQDPVLATGRGEKMEPLPINLSGNYIYIVVPDLHISTAEAFRDITPRQPVRSIDQVLAYSIETWRDHLINDFEATVIRKYPVIQTIKDQLYNSGALYASMSGSGSAVYGIFDKEPELKKLFPNFFCWKSDRLVL